MYTFLFFLVIILVVLVLTIHMWTSSRETDGMGRPDKEYREYLKQPKSQAAGLSDIPPPPGGIRDAEVETLLKSGNFRAARELLVIRMEEARMAPLGRDAKIARATHYMSLLR